MTRPLAARLLATATATALALAAFAVIAQDTARPTAPTATAASAQPASAVVSGTASAGSPASSPTPPSDAGGPPERDIERDPPRNDPSDPPTAEEWNSAPTVHLASATPACRAQLVREWLRVTCTTMPKSLALLSGSPEGIHLTPLLDPMEHEHRPDPSITFPLRRGDRRLFQFAAYKPLTKFCNEAETIILSEQWLETDPGPLVTTHLDTSPCY